MDEALINNWNETVSVNNIVYILGDLVFRSDKHATYYIDRLKGMKHLILGNHDHKWIKNCNLQKYFESVSYYHEIKDGLAFETLKQMDNALNAGVEINSYRPVTLDELILNNRKFMMG